MKFLVSILLIAFLSFTACLYLDWWSIAIAAFIVAVAIPQRAGKSFLAAFIALFLLWSILSFWLSSNNDHLLAHKMSMLILKLDNPYLLMLITGLLGGLIAGLAAVSGSLLRRSKSK
ncbi:MAG: hypothetical protein JST86_12980 [Bacteroidetes bacterium]|nr:hypothetical protein [Bacteroidota bacterium]